MSSHRPTFTELHRSRIQDHNAEGYDSVDSEEFDAGFGCVAIEEPRRLEPPPPVVSKLSDEEIEQEKYYQWWLGQQSGRG